MFVADETGQTTFDDGIRRQFAQLVNSVLLGGQDNTFTGEDAYWGQPTGMHQGVTADGRVFTVGLPNGTAPGSATALMVPTSLLLLAAAAALALLLLKKG